MTNPEAHPTRNGWCCACDADIAFALDWMQKEPEFKQLIADSNRKAIQELLNRVAIQGGEMLAELSAEDNND